MKNLGRLSLLLVIISVLAVGVVYAVNNTSISGTEPQSAFNPQEFQPPTGQDQQGQLLEDARPPLPGMFHEREGGGSFAALEIIKNLGIILGITAVVVIIDKGSILIKKRKKAAAQS